MPTKYDALGSHLATCRGDRIPFSFHDIEAVLGFRLPNSKRYPAWWSNNPSNNTMTKVWLDAGFETEQVDTSEERLVFRRARRSQAQSGGNGNELRSGPFPGFGCMAGTIEVPPDVDLTQPADTEWGRRAQ